MPWRIFTAPILTRNLVMNTFEAFLQAVLYLSAFGQFALAMVNLRLNRLLAWDDDLNQLPLLLREVFQVHKWFISITLTIFAVLTWRFAGTFAQGTVPLANWLAIGIGLFWGIRLVIQWAFYSTTHWQGDRNRTFIHGFITFVYGGWTLVYLTAGLSETVRKLCCQ